MVIMSMTAKGRIIPSMIGAVGVSLWATETTLINLAPRIPPLEIVALAFGFAALMTPLVWLCTGENPFDAFKLPKWVWLVMVLSLVGYHSCIYFATQRAPAAPAALLQGTTPLLIVLGSAFLPGERLRWWHMLGAGLGFCGVLSLINAGGTEVQTSGNAIFYLSLIGIAAGLWGLYSVVTRSLADVPTSSLGMFYGASAVLAMVAHLSLESWVTPVPSEWLVIAALGIFPMGLAIYFWDYGVKRGDIQALGVFSYAEPFIGAALVALVTGAAIRIDFLWSGALLVAGAVVASASLWKSSEGVKVSPHVATEAVEAFTGDLLPSEMGKEHLALFGNVIMERLAGLEADPDAFLTHENEMKSLVKALRKTMTLLNEIHHKSEAAPGAPVPTRRRRRAA
jgi:drug/metabolite transporter (DMT)-like permease